MRRAIAVLCCASLALVPSTALAKKHKKTALGPVFGVSATGNVGSGGSSSTATAMCPPGVRVIGGGFFTPPRSTDGEALVYESYRSSRQGWTSSAVPVGGNPITVVSYGYCRRTNKKIADVIAGGSVPPGGVGSAAARCPAGTRLVAGGFQSSVAGSGGGAATPATSMATSRSTWTLVSVSGGTETSSITVHAYCMHRVTAPVFVASQRHLTLPIFVSLTVQSPRCPVAKKPKRKGKRKPMRQLSAGGFSNAPTPSAPLVRIFNSARTPPGWTVAAQNTSGPDAETTLTSQGICL